MGPQEDTHTEPDNDNSRSLILTTSEMFFDIELIHKVRRIRFRLGIKGGQENDDEWGLRKTDGGGGGGIPYEFPTN
jgi:hypothetical protein